jgi:hypothetical protein
LNGACAERRDDVEHRAVERHTGFERSGGGVEWRPVGPRAGVERSGAGDLGRGARGGVASGVRGSGAARP